MKILLLEDIVFFPSYGGGNKANRLLMTELASRGHECSVVSKCAGLGNASVWNDDREELAARGIPIDHEDADGFAYRFQGVFVQALNLPPSRMVPHIMNAVERTKPDWILVSDDREHTILDAALKAGQRRVILIVHTHIHLPFGKEARREDPHQLELIRQARGIVVVSRYSQRYLAKHGGLRSDIIRFPVYGSGPFLRRNGGAGGFVTMINPCVRKGLPIFLELARQFPEVEFGAVPTWGATARVIAELSSLPNVHRMQPADDIGCVLSHTRILLVPSLMPETFGYVVVDAMLRGIPVIASNLGGLPEAKLGVDYLLPVTPAVETDGVVVSEAQDAAPWSDALRELLRNKTIYNRCSRASHDAALRFVASADVSAFEKYLATR